MPQKVPLFEHLDKYIKSAVNAESKKLEREISLVRQRQKQLVSLISDKSGVPDGCGPEMLKAFLTLKDGN